MSELKLQAVSVLKAWVANVNAGNVDGLMDLYVDDAILMPTFSEKVLETQSKIRAYFEGLGARAGAKVSLDDESSIVATIVDESVVILAGKYTFFFDDESGNSVPYPSRFTFVIAPDQEQPIKHQHSSVVPE